MRKKWIIDDKYDEIYPVDGVYREMCESCEETFLESEIKEGLCSTCRRPTKKGES